MNQPTDLVLTLEDLPTMRRLTNLIKQTAEDRTTKYNSRTDLEATAITTFWKHTQAFIETLTEELEAIETQANR